jgi:dienelactone hydrolase
MRNPVMLTTVVFAVVMAQTPDFSAQGRHGWGYRTEDIPGTTEVMAGSRIYFPDSAGEFPRSAVPAPIVVFGHGWLMGIDRYYSYAEHLASWGYVTVLPTISNPITNPEHDKRARLMADAARFTSALDTVPGDRFFGRLDRWNWGFAGHSMGGSISLLAADTLGLYDTLRSIVALASPQTTPPTHSEHLLVPKLLLPGSVDNIAPWQDVRSAFWADAPPPGTFAVIRGANHGYYMDYSNFWENGGNATITRDTQQMIARRHMTAYFERYLHGDSSAWNFVYTYGDSIQHHPTMETVEVRLLPGLTEGSLLSLVPGFSTGTNPARGRVLIRYGMPESGAFSLAVYDARGLRVRSLADRREPAGVRVLAWDGNDDNGSELPAGTYFIRFASPGRALTRRLVLLR